MVLFTGSLFSDNIFVRGQGGMKMDEIWKKAVIAAMEKKVIPENNLRQKWKSV